MRASSDCLKSVRASVRIWLPCALTALALVPVCLWAAAPEWWTQRGVTDPAATADDYAVANQGQVRHIARQAYEEMKEKLPGGAGATLDALWAAPPAGADDYIAVNLGQLKNTARPFHDRLIEAGLASAYPWTASAYPADDYALANIGQVKNLFAFGLPSAPVIIDTDQDGIPDDEEAAHGTDPRKYSSGGNGAPDGWWIAHGLSPFSPAGQDTDGDGRSDAQEFLDGTDPLTPDSAPNPSAAAPAAATQVAAATLEPGRYRITWKNNASILLRNIVERSEDGGAVWVTVGVVGPENTGFTDATAEPGSVYFYRIVAYN